MCEHGVAAAMTNNLSDKIKCLCCLVLRSIEHNLVNKTGLKKGDPLSPILSNLALEKVIQSTKMVPSGIKVDKEELNVLAYADDVALIGKNLIEIRKFL